MKAQWKLDRRTTPATALAPPATSPRRGTSSPLACAASQELLGTRVFVFTANGEILNLARGAMLRDVTTPLGTSLESHVGVINCAPLAELMTIDDA